MRIGVLGATGQAGRDIAKWLIKKGFAETVLIGRNADKLARLRDELVPFSPHVPELVLAEASDQASLVKAFNDLDMVVIAISSSDWLSIIVDAAIATQTDCLDILLCSEKKRKLLEAKRNLFERYGITYITDGGYHPGIPAALARYAESLCPGLQTVEVYGSFGVDWRQRTMSRDTIVDFVRQIRAMDMGVLKDGAWVSDWRNKRTFDFGDGRGPQDCMPMGMDEMRELPHLMPALANTGFFIAGFGRIVDWWIIPFALFALKLCPCSIRYVSRLFAWGLKKFSSDKDWARLHLKASGVRGNLEILMTYKDAYELTALPVVACLKQYEERPHKPGLYRQALFVEPRQFVDDLKDMSVFIGVNPPTFPTAFRGTKKAST